MFTTKYSTSGSSAQLLLYLPAPILKLVTAPASKRSVKVVAVKPVVYIKHKHKGFAHFFLSSKAQRVALTPYSTPVTSIMGCER